MNDWVVETPTLEEDLMNNRIIMLNQKGVNRVVEIIKEKNKEIERLKKENNILKEALLFIWKDYKKDVIDIDELEKALKELKGDGSNE